MEPERDKLRDEIGVDSFQFVEEIQNLISVPPEAGSSFTALLELPANQAVKLLHSPGSEGNTRSQPYDCSAYFMPDIPIADGRPNLAWPETNSISIPADFEEVKQEPVDSDLLPNSSLILSDPVVSKSTKRKERDKKVKSTKKSKSTEKEINKDADNLPYVHVRARRGQATDSHSLAERARREKINARMKLLQELVPGCNKISGTAMVLDEIINHVQSLQRQVEFLSMRLAAVHPRIDINLDSLFTAETGSLMDYNFPGMVSSSLWVEGQINGNVQQYQKLWHSAAVHQPVWGRKEGNPNFIIPENSIMSYDSSANSACLHRNQLKMEI